MACDKLFRRELFIRNNVRFPVGLLHEDVPTIYQLFYFAESVSVVEEPFYYWVRRDGSISKSISLKHVLDFFTGFILTREFLQKHDVLDRYWVYFVRRVVHFSLGMNNRLRSDPDSRDVENLIALIRQWMSVLGVTSKSSLEALRSYDIDIYKQYMIKFANHVVPIDPELVKTQKKLYGVEKKLEGTEERLERTEKQLENIEQSSGYRFLRRLDSVVNTTFPAGTRRRFWLRRFISVFLSKEQVHSRHASGRMR